MSEQLDAKIADAVAEFEELNWGNATDPFMDFDIPLCLSELSQVEQKKALSLIRRATTAAKKALALWRPIYLLMETGSFDSEIQDEDE